MKLSHRRKLIHKKGTIRKWREARQRRRLRRKWPARQMGGFIRHEDSCFSRDAEEIASLAQPRNETFPAMPVVVVSNLDPEITKGIDDALKGIVQAAKHSEQAVSQLSKAAVPPKGLWDRFKASLPSWPFGAKSA